MHKRITALSFYKKITNYIYYSFSSASDISIDK